jgi:hypothetical protein
MIREKTRESATLDYKRVAALGRQDALKAEISKDVSSFANAGGGVIIYGIAENAGHEADHLDGVDPKLISKEWLEDVISSGIRRRIDGLKIHVVDLSGELAGLVAYVVEIPQSLRAPHMAADHRYYKRHNFKSAPMEEYEVRDVSLRGQAPQLGLELVTSAGESFPMTERKIQLDLLLINGSREPASLASIKLAVDARLLVDGSSRLCEVWSVAGSEPQLLPVSHHTFFWGGPQVFPVFAGLHAKATAVRFEALDKKCPGPYVIWWSIATPRAPESAGAAIIHWRSDSELSFDTLTIDELARYDGIDWCPTEETAYSRFSALHTAHNERRPKVGH